MQATSSRTHKKACWSTFAHLECMYRCSIVQLQSIYSVKLRLQSRPGHELNPKRFFFGAVHHFRIALGLTDKDGATVSAAAKRGVRVYKLATFISQKAEQHAGTSDELLHQR